MPKEAEQQTSVEKAKAEGTPGAVYRIFRPKKFWEKAVAAIEQEGLSEKDKNEKLEQTADQATLEAAKQAVNEANEAKQDSQQKQERLVKLFPDDNDDIPVYIEESEKLAAEAEAAAEELATEILGLSSDNKQLTTRIQEMFLLPAAESAEEIKPKELPQANQELEIPKPPDTGVEIVNEPEPDVEEKLAKAKIENKQQQEPKAQEQPEPEPVSEKAKTEPTEKFIQDLEKILISESIGSAEEILTKAKEQGININSEKITNAFEKSLTAQMKAGFFDNIAEIVKVSEKNKIKINFNDENFIKVAKDGIHNAILEDRKDDSNEILNFAKEKGIDLDLKKLKSEYRKALLLVHPDKVVEEQKEQAQELFKMLDENYKNSDFYGVETIIDYIKQNPLDLKSEQKAA